MNLPHPPSDTPARYRLRWWGLAGAALAIALGTAYALSVERGRILAAQHEMVRNRADLLEQRVGALIASSDLALRALARRWSGRAGDAALDELRLLDDATPALHDLTLTDADGRVLAATGPETGSGPIAAQPYFAAARDARGLRLSAPSPAESGRAVLRLTRALRDGSGQFAGVVTATLDPASLMLMLDALEFGPGVAVALLDPRGALLLRSRHLRDGDASAPTPPAAGTATTTTLSVLQPVRAAGLAIEGAPLAWVARDEAAALREWRQLAWLVGTLLLLATAAAAAGLRWMQATEARHAGQLAQTHDRLERIAQTVPGTLCQFELQPDGRARMPFTTRPLEPTFGLSASLVPGSADVMFEYMHPDDVQGMRDAVLASAKTMALFSHEWRMRVPGQPERWVEVHSAPQRMPDGGTLWTGYVADVSDKHAVRATQMALDAAERASRSKSEFLSRASHELRTPLNAVIGFSTLLLGDSRYPLAAPQREQIRHIQDAGQHLLVLINDLLDVSAVEAGRVQATIGDLQLQGIVDEVLAATREQAARAGVTLQSRAAQDGLAARADRVRLRQVLLNLVSNAIKFNHRGGDVTVTLEPAGAERVRIDVDDTGAGLSAEQQSHLFEPFNRLGAERHGIAGTGIGLTISKMLVELMGGRIEVLSTPGRGSRFSITLDAARRPELASAPAVAPALPATPSLVGATPVLKVLYAEDNAMNAALVQQAMALCPAVELRVAASGAQALREAAATPPDLVLIDMHLGDMDGFELLRTLRASPATKAVPAIALTADATPATMLRASEVGFCDYLTKPIDIGALLMRLERQASAKRVPVAA